MATLGVVFDIIAKDRASSELRKIGNEADRTGDRVSKFGGAAKAGFALAAVGVGALAGGLAFFVKEAAESAKIGRLTEAVVKSTGGAAKITAGQVGDLAEAISNKTAIDDEAIQGGANLLLTFTKVRNEVGKGNDIFNQAAQAAVDMSVALGTDVSAASLQLGKALNDPIKGVAALSKAGVSFTQQQKDQIKTLVESGKTLDAQKIILKEFEIQFGGAAAAAADPIARLKVVLGNLGEDIGGLVLPVVEKFATLVTDRVVPAVKSLLAGFDGKGPIDGFAGSLNTLGLGVRALFEAFKNPDVTSNGFVGFMEGVGVAARGAFEYFKSDVLPRLRDFGGFLRDEVLPRLVEFGGYLKDTVLPILVRVVQDGLEGLKLGLEFVKEKFKENKPELETFVGLLRTIADFVVTRVLPVLGPLLGAVLAGIGVAIVGLMEGIGLFVKAVQAGQQAILGFASGALGAFQSVLGALAKLPGPFQQTFRDAAFEVGKTKAVVDGLKLAAEEAARPKVLKISVESEQAVRAIADVKKSLGSLGSGASINVKASQLAGVGDGPGAGGSMLSRVSKLIAGTGMSVTSTYRTPARNAAVGGSPSSYHLDRNNPAVDVVGPAGALTALQNTLRAGGGLRELLWQVPGHYDHLHVAHSGGTVDQSWARMPGDRPDERTARLQVGERVLSRAEVAQGGGTTVHAPISVTVSDPAQVDLVVRRLEWDLLTGSFS